MHVNDAVTEFSDEVWTQDRHESCQDDHVDISFLKNADKSGLEIVTVLIVTSQNHSLFDVIIFCSGKCVSILIVGYYELDGTGVDDACLFGVDQSLKVGPASGYQYRDIDFFHDRLLQQNYLVISVSLSDLTHDVGIFSVGS